ncbi:hypothetical protein [Salimicrobium salexigens]|uniref:Uncharacterized protein n=1 Tax=Salimicrobium salexigens TaxID=908941 RepID=A0ABY1KKH0_9BACI|nr:hypothetical protein [Salimicrobium salexigens]SIS45543.1 hypothetical protein SAMN05421758_101186 [Salimicrobium salexigens]
MKAVKVLGEDTIEENEIAGWVYKNLKPVLKMNRSLNTETVQKGIKQLEKLYYPLWAIKILVIAERKPFPPKITPNMIFVDGISGYRGVFTSIPPTGEKNAQEASVLSPVLYEKEVKTKYVKDVQEKQINRKYVLKKPKYQMEDIELLYLPIWKTKVETSFFSDTFYINGNTGESEDLLMKLAESKEWLI